MKIEIREVPANSPKFILPSDWNEPSEVTISKINPIKVPAFSSTIGGLPQATVEHDGSLTGDWNAHAKAAEKNPYVGNYLGLYRLAAKHQELTRVIEEKNKLIEELLNKIDPPDPHKMTATEGVARAIRKSR